MENNIALLCRCFVDEMMNKSEVLDIKIPKNFDIEDCDNETQFILRNLFDVDTSRSYAQTFAVFSFLLELVVGEN